MKRRFSGAGNRIPAILLTVSVPIFATCLSLFLAGLLVEKQDLYGFWLTVLLYICVIPGSCCAALALRRRFRLKGILCGLIGGGGLGLAYLAVLLCWNRFSLRPGVLPILPFAMLVSAICGIVYSNFTGR